MAGFDHAQRTAPAVAPDDGDWVLVPRDLTDDMAETIAAIANCCGGIADSAWRAALDAVPSASISERERGLVEALRNLENYIRHTPHHNAPEAAAARRVLTAQERLEE